MAPDLFTRLWKLKVSIRLLDGKLDVQAPKGVLSAELISEIRAHKEELIQYLSSGHKQEDEYTEIPKIFRQESYAVSSSQHRLWILSQFEDANSAYNMSGAYIFEGPLNTESLQYAVKTLVERHETLHTVFREDGADGVRQHILPVMPAHYLMKQEDLRDAVPEAEALNKKLEQEALTPFDLAEGPLLRTMLFQLEDSKWMFFHVMHHIISDDWSMGVLMRELLLLYNAFCDELKNPLAPLRIQYKDYAAWQQRQLSGVQLVTHQAYWMRQLMLPLPEVNLPADKIRPAARTYNGGEVSRFLQTGLVLKMHQLCRDSGASLFMGVTALVNTLLFRYTGQEDIVIGTPISGRTHADLEDQIGFFVNTLALRTRFSGAGSFKELLHQVKEVTLDAFTHQVYPFDELVMQLNLPRDMSRNPVFDIMVDLRNQDPVNEGPAETHGSIPKDVLTAYPYHGSGTVKSKFDISFNFLNAGDKMIMNIVYNSDIYSRFTAEQLLMHQERLMELVVDNPSMPLNGLPLLTEGEKGEIVSDFNQYEEPDTEPDIISRFEQTAVIFSSAVAVIDHASSLSYYELNARANRLAQYLREKYDAAPEMKIGVCLEKSAWLPVCILGILKSGAAFVPVDPAYPAGRIQYIIDNSNCAAVINALWIDEFEQHESRYSGENLQVTIAPSQLAYVIYTSGSTGHPKGVMVEHGQIASFFNTSLQRELMQTPVVAPMLASTAFDISVFELLLPLLSGGSLLLPADAEIRDLELLATRLQDCTAFHAVPALMAQLLNHIRSHQLQASFTSLQHLFTGGDAVPAALLQQMQEVFPGVRLHVFYGPTESTIFVTTQTYLPGYTDGFLGSPLGHPNTNSLLYILDAQLQPVPVGVPGEICVGGRCVTRGYLGQAELTAEKFISNPFIPNQRIYRTGDIGRWLPDGCILFAGRADEQVKIRGYRIEPGEIAAVLERHEAIREALVMVRGEAAADQELVAYVVTVAPLHVQEITAWLGARLPAYMVPSSFVPLEAMPLTPNGKVDRRKLPEPEGLRLKTSVEYITPRNETEAKLAAIWQELLGRETISVKDNFFEIGGHSLRATRLSGFIHKTFEVKLNLKDIFSHAILEDQARLIVKFGKTIFTSIPVAPAQESYPLSSPQRRLWVLCQFEEANVAYNMPGVYYFDGTLNPEGLQWAFSELIRRHEVLRTAFVPDDEGGVQQVVLPPIPFQLTFLDLRHDTAQDDRISGLIAADNGTAFNLEKGRLLRASIYQVSDNRWLFSFVMHHIISDGWSMEVLVRELLMVYNGYVRGNATALPELRIQYKDYSVWQQQQLGGELLGRSRQYWLNNLSGDIPVLNLPGDYQRPHLKTYNGKFVTRTIDPGVAGRLTELTRERGGTLFSGLLAVLHTLLYRYTGQEDIIIGTPIAGRDHPDLEGQIGFYINTLALRARISGSDTFVDALKKTASTTLNAYEHQLYPFDELTNGLGLRRDLSRNPLFDIMLVLQNQDLGAGTADSAITLDNLKISGYPGGDDIISETDFIFDVTETGNGLQLVVKYNRDIYAPVTVAQMTRHFESLLQALTEQPGLPVRELKYLAAAETQQLLEVWSGLRSPYPTDKTIGELFSAQARLTPGKTALIFEDRQLSYQQLEEQTNRLAAYIRGQYQIAADDLVGVLVDRSDMLIIAILAILKAGAGYVPMDADFPAARKAFIAQDTRMKVLITQSDYIFDLDYFSGEVFALDIQTEYEAAAPDELPALAGSGSLAYIMYTSGSTGQPKGVMVEHRSAVRLVKNNNFVSLTGNETILSTGAVSFDAVTFEYWAALLNGGCLVICSKETLLDASKMKAVMERHAVNMIWVTAGWMHQLVDDCIDLFQGLQTLLAGGDRLSPIHIGKLKAAYPQLSIINGYGPTENTTFSLTHLVTGVSGSIPIGKPVANSTVYILDDYLQPLPVGITGEIIVGGDGLARGYLNQPELTAERFVPHPFITGERIYKTGDLGRWLQDGTVEFMGRKDTQVKIRGYRVEPGEIETVLQSHEQVEAAVVVARLLATAEKELVAYLVTAVPVETEVLKAWLAGRLPVYMIPARFVSLDTLPLTANGKVDYNNLPVPEGINTGVVYEAPRNETEAALAGIWEEVLGVKKVGIKDNFFDLGGHSLKATRLASLIHKAFEVRVDLKDLFTHVVLEDQALVISRFDKTVFTGIVPLAVREGYVVSSAQKRLWVLSQFEEAAVAYNISGIYLFEGKLNVEALQYALQVLVERHETLRTVFRGHDAEGVRQYILPVSPGLYRIKQQDLRGHNATATDLHEQLAADAMAPFDLAAGPLLRTSLYQQDNQHWIFFYAMHHIISDGWSMGVLMRELISCYNAYNTGKENPLRPLRIQYKDYAAWQQSQLDSPEFEQHRAYWRQQFSGELPVLTMPYDNPRPALQTFNGSSVEKLLDATVSSTFRKIIQQEGGTLFMGLLAAVNSLLYCYSGQDDIIIGTSVAGRNHADLEEQIGFYVNTLALRCRNNGDKNFRGLLSDCIRLSMDAFAHQLYPFDRLVDELEIKRDLSRGALFDVLLVLQNNSQTEATESQMKLDDLTVKQYAAEETADSASKFDLQFSFGDAGDTLALSIQYNTDLFLPDTMHRMLDHFEQLLAAMVQQPDTPLNDLTFLSSGEQAMLTDLFNNTAVEYGCPLTVPAAFEAQVEKTPDRVALVYDGAPQTYQQLNAVANKMAFVLINDYEVKPGDLVGLHADRSAWFIAAVLGILKAGAAYVPMDTAYPADRIAYMTETCACRLVIDDQFIEAIAPKMVVAGGNNPGVAVLPGGLAYVMFTSGSTGRPKGVMVEHKSIIRLAKPRHFLPSAGDEVLISTSAISFDVSTFEYWTTLLNGGLLVLYPNEVLLDPQQLAGAIVRHKATTMWFTSGWLHQLAAEHIEVFSRLHTIVAGGDRLSAQHIKKIRRAYPHLQIVNGYGPTENTTFSTTHHIDQPGDDIPIGRPLDNSTAYIIHRNMQLAPLGVAGEIYVGGDGLARGYINQPALTAEKFVPHPWKPGERLYKTGDLGRWLPDGTIQFTGRKDDQVKIRGYRIEPGETEAVLQQHEAITTAAVIVHVRPDGDKELVAYVVCGDGVTESDLKVWLTGRLPAFMVPAYFVLMAALPLTANGKVDKRRLPPPEGLALKTTVDYVAPRNDAEAKLVAIWQEVLGRENIGVKDNFFDLGGHSLKATRLATLIHKTFDVKPGLKELFTHTVLEDQAAAITRLEKNVFTGIAKLESQEGYVVSSAQQRLWVLSQFEDATIAYNMAGIYVFDGTLNIEALQYALRVLVERHETLRTVFRADEAGTVRQFILPVSPGLYSIKLEDLRGQPAAAAAINERLAADALSPFDLAAGPLLRTSLYQQDDQQWIFFYAMHHIISDGWSMGVLIRELIVVYNVYNAGIAIPLKPLRIHYKDYAAWQQAQLNGPDFEKHRAYWHRQFSGALPVLSLPYDKPRPALQTYHGDDVSAIIDAGTTKALRKLTQEQGGTLFMGLLGIVNSLLYCYSGQDDMIIGTPVAGRNHADLEDQIGFYVNTLALRCRNHGDNDFKAILKNCVQLSMDAFAHQAYPFDGLVDELEVKRDLSRNALFDVMMVLQNNSQIDESASGLSLDGLVVKNYDGGATGGGISKFDLQFTFVEVSDELAVTIQYNTDLFLPQTIKRMCTHLELLLTAMVAQPETPLNSLNFLTAEERTFLIDTINNTRLPYIGPVTIPGSFEAQAGKTPDRIAVSCGGADFTYRELNEAANQFAFVLINDYGVKSGDLVGLRTDRSDWLMAAILGTLKAGAAYVPLDTGYPDERIAFMTEACNCRLVIDDRLVEEIQPRLTAAASNNPGIVVEPGNLAYVMFTSGSTGRPKGVMVEHKSVVRLATSGAAGQVTGNEVIIATSAISFDASTFEYWTTLLNGGQLVLYPNEVLLDPLQLADAIARHKATMMWFTAGWLHQLVDHHIEVFAGLQTIVAGGDKLSPHHIQKLKSAYPQAIIINGYGPTENTTFSLTHKVDEVGDYIPLGRPIGNSTAYVLHRDMQPASIGVMGEIYVGGDGLARGYINDSALTAEKFVPHPWKPGERLYKTGDLGRLLPDGTIQFGGRKDDQVKIRGYRIEPGEIEAVLRQYEAIETVVIVAHTGNQDEKVLAAYFTSNEEIHSQDVTKWLGYRLPAFMIPAFFVQLKELPLTANGKVDRRRLPRPDELALNTTNAYVAPRNHTEELLAGIWQEVLGRENIGAKDNFFELGGHSLKATRLASLIHRAFNVKLALKDIFTHTVLEDQARLIDTASFTAFEMIPAAPVMENYPLSSSQRRLWILSQFEAGSAAYNMPGIHVLEGPLNADAFDFCFSQLTARHESLRTIIKEDSGGILRQYILPASHHAFQLQVQDIRREPARDELMNLLAQEAFTRPFNLEEGPLVWAALYRLEDEKWVFIYVMHHIISDGWSMGVLASELFTLYNSRVKGGPNPLAPLRIQYKDYAVWQQQQLDSPAMQQHRAYWLEQFSGDLPVLELQGDKPRPAVKTYRGDTVAAILPAALTSALREAAVQSGGTLFMSLLTVVNSLLYCYTGQDDIIIGTPVAGRNHADLEGQIGFYVNTLALRCRLTGADNFHSASKKMRQLTMNAFAHQAYPFDELVGDLNLQRDTSRNALFDVMMVLQNAEPAGSAPAGMDEIVIADFISGKGEGVSKFDLLFSFTEAGGEIVATIEFNNDIWLRTSIERMMRHLEQIAVACTLQPGTTLDELNFLTADEKIQLTADFNDTAVAYPRDASVVHLFEAQVAATPANTALISGDLRLSYTQLNEVANRLAHWLTNNYGIKPGDRVALQLDRGHWMLISILAVLKTGAAYVPLDPIHPEERIAYMVESSQCKLVITSLLLQEAEQQLVFCSPQNPAEAAHAESLAYIMFTSGSTGQPKGVMVQHRGVVRLVKPATYIGVTGHEVLLATAAVSFDVTTFEFWITLLHGGCLVVAPNEVLLDAKQLAAQISKHRVNTMWFTAGWLQQLVDDHIYVFTGLRTIIAGGDALPVAHIRKIRLAYPDVRIINGYGPTENTTFSTTFEIQEVPSAIAIGKPINNSTAYIVHRNLQLAPVGVLGEILTGGDGVALGYINQPDFTAEKFIDSPFKQGERLYRTGDWGRWRPDGNIEFFGRMDSQVKIRGYRIEPGEVEAVIQHCPGVEKAVVLVTAGPQKEKQLVAWITGAAAPAPDEMRKMMSSKLPSWMLPAHFIYLETLPLNANGKVDRKQLPMPEYDGRHTGVEFIAPRNEKETAVAAVWTEVLGRTQIGVKDNFFESGGNSISAIRLQGLLKRRCYIGLKMKDIFNHPTVEEMAQGGDEQSHLLHLSRDGEDGRVNMFCLPPVLGHSMLFRPLAERLEGRFNCFGMQYSGLEHNEPFYSSIQEAARDCYQEIAAQQPVHEPFVLMGYSMGVPIAFETAKLLEAGGWKPGLVLVDRNADHDDGLQDNEAVLHTTVSWLMNRYMAILPGIPLDTNRLRAFLDNNLRILAAYRASGQFSGAAVLVAAGGGHPVSGMDKWLPHTGSGTRIEIIQSGHWELLDEVNLYMFENILEHFLILR